MTGKWEPSATGHGEVLQGARFHAVFHNGLAFSSEKLSADNAKVFWAVHRNDDREVVASGELGGWGFSALDKARHLRPTAKRLARSALKVFEGIEDDKDIDHDID